MASKNRFCNFRLLKTDKINIIEMAIFIFFAEKSVIKIAIVMQAYNIDET